MFYELTVHKKSNGKFRREQMTFFLRGICCSVLTDEYTAGMFLETYGGFDSGRFGRERSLGRIFGSGSKTDVNSCDAAGSRLMNGGFGMVWPN